MQHGGGSVSGPLPVRQIQTSNSQKGLNRVSPRLSSSSPVSSPRELGVFAKSHPIPEEAELAAHEGDADGARSQREGQQGAHREER